MKPMLASDWDEAKVRYPVIAQPKIDGVRALNTTGVLTGRSLKKHKNVHVTTLLSHSAMIGFDGELAAERETHPDLCRITSSAMGTITGQPYVLWWLFDYVTPQTRELPYHKRLEALRERVDRVAYEAPHLHQHLRVIPSHECSHAAVLHHFDSTWLEQGYEGSILRDPYAPHKAGRSTVREGGLLRIKRFVEEEAVVTAVTEGEHNANEAKLNELGHTERSTHQANMVPNGMVGTLTCTSLKEVSDGERVLIQKGQTITVSAGRLTADERRRYFQHQDEIIGRTIKYQFFPKGIKDKPRFPTFQAFRDAADMGDGS